MRPSAAQSRTLALLVDNASDAIVVIDDERRIIDVNPAASMLLGLPRDELRGRAIDDSLPSEDASRLAESWPSLIREGKGRGEFTVVDLDGARRDVEYSATANFLSGRHVALLRDVTERRQLEIQLRQAQRLESVGRLAGGVAHDFNNLLMVISGYAQLIQSDLEADDSHRDDLDEILRAAGRSAELTRQLLAFSRQQVLQPRALDLNGVVTAIGPMLCRVIGEDVALETVLAPDLGVVLADPGQLEQVLMNLVVNARDAMPEGGQITIETANVELDAAYAQTHAAVKPGSFVLLAVSDTGVGMDAETQRQLFEPFFTTKPASEGTGLGLATVYGIVKQSGGSIWAYSEPGLGSTFKIYLPRVAGPAEPITAVAATASTQGGTETILVVEDDAAVRGILTAMLRRHGYHVLEASDGRAAVDLAAGPEEPDLLITDLVMPGMSGRELADRLAAQRPGLRTLFASGYGHNTLVRRGALEPSMAYLAKPFGADELARKVRELLDARGQAGQQERAGAAGPDQVRGARRPRQRQAAPHRPR